MKKSVVGSYDRWFMAVVLFLIQVLPNFSDAATKGPTSGVSAAQALSFLKEGNLRFVQGKPLHEMQMEAHRQSLIHEQKPFAILLSCSDSRVPPEIIFDQGLGDLFVVRVAGNILDDATAASIEYAVDHLGSRLIVVMGHDSCGAVKAALSSSCEAHAASPDLDHLISSIQRAVGCKSSKDLRLALDLELEKDPLIRKSVMKNAQFVARHLGKRSVILKKYLDSGELKIIPAIYSLEQGTVEFSER